MKLYMLDTNTISHLIKGQPNVARHLLAQPMATLCISAVTEGELRFGLARRPDAKRLHKAVMELLLRVETLAWNSAVSECYGSLRAEMECRGKPLAPLDMLIAAHALCVGTTLVSNDAAFSQVPGLLIEDWTQA